MPQVTVEEFHAHVRAPLELKLFAGVRGLQRLLKSARIQKPGLALAGYSAFVHPDRVQILGQTELSYLMTLPAERRDAAIGTLTALNLACLLVTKNLPIPDALISACDETMTPLFRTPMTSSECIRKILAYLDDLLSPRCRVHGVLVDVSGVGVLITGASGIGKSECALDLVLRGHRLVADDVVEIRRRGEDLVGQAATIIQNLIEIRGLGILNVAELYGVAATRDHKRIEMQIQLEMWSEDAAYDRIGLDEQTRDILGIGLNAIVVPVRPGRNLAGIIEVAARNFLLRLRGHHAAIELNQRIRAGIDRIDEPRMSISPRREEPADLALREGPADLGTAARSSSVKDHIEDEVE